MTNTLYSILIFLGWANFSLSLAPVLLTFPKLPLACARRLIHAPDAFEAHTGLSVAYAHPPQRVVITGSVISALQIHNNNNNKGSSGTMDIRFLSDNGEQSVFIWLDETNGTPLFFVTITIVNVEPKKGEEGTNIQLKFLSATDEAKRRGAEVIFLDFMHHLQGLSTAEFVSLSRQASSSLLLLARHRAVFIRQQKRRGGKAFDGNIDWQ